MVTRCPSGSLEGVLTQHSSSIVGSDRRQISASDCRTQM